MAQFQSILGVVLIVCALIIVILSIWHLVIIGKARTNLEDSNSTITDGEKRGAYGTNVILMIIGIVLGVYGVVLVLPTEKTVEGITKITGRRSAAGSVLSPGV